MYLNNPQMYYYENLAKKMYPKEYHKILPYVQDVCNREDNPYNYTMHPFPQEEKINELVNEVYVNYTRKTRITSEEDLKRSTRHHHHHDPYHNHHDHCKDNPINDIIKILIIKELLDRRRCRRGHWWC